MGTLQKNLDIVFRGIQPEMLFRSIAGGAMWDSAGRLSASCIPSDVFYGLALSQYPSCSFEEIEGIRSVLEAEMSDFSRPPLVFFLLVKMGRRVFRLGDNGLVCRFSELLAWQNVYQKLGQDIFTAAFLAYEDVRLNEPQRTDFTWDAVMKTDHPRLNAALRRGLAENHCHLGGTTQNFPLTWACAMNYPNTIWQIDKLIPQNLQPNLNRGVSGNVWPWRQRLLWAAYLRLVLFEQLEGIRNTDSLNMEKACFYPMLQIQQKLGYVRTCFAAKVPQRGGGYFILDYALRRTDCKNGLLSKHNRLLSGERSFLYRCFRACFDDSFDDEEKNWFYMYLLLKENFRAEMIQVNRQTGFDNFRRYQDRKDAIYNEIAGYHDESVRLSVNANQENQNILSFEARIAPKDSPFEMRRQVKSYERQIQYAAGRERDNYRHFYVYHFIKSPDTDADRFQHGLIRPRNYNIRLSCRKKTRALGYALQHFPAFCSLVRGIDSANTEIGCRPEVFAEGFRYLRNLPPLRRVSCFEDTPKPPALRITYHAGEDFLDLADGLRSVDEAVKFLHLRRGDRIGHGLALGVDPVIHYRFKHGKAILSKQELLDNLVWLLFRSQELDIQISTRMYGKLQTQAKRYLFELYGNCPRCTYLDLYEYYCAMQLRGDNPEPACGGRFSFCLDTAYNAYRLDEGEALKGYRSSRTVSAFFYAYHFDAEVRTEGGKMQEFSIDSDYIELIRGIQDKLMEELMERGIMIECNPTSNYLIGTFRRYDTHPIFRFNNTALVRVDGRNEPSAQLSVSINTDDSGVFDTSLEHEYAVLAAALEHMQIDGHRKYTSDSIYIYLEHVRRMGFEQSFLSVQNGNKQDFE